ncbi:MAG: hypothetical protein KF892_02430 [Rhizobacter sp.]|nr:hypothetical protein [Rhizobacter sp.]
MTRAAQLWGKKFGMQIARQRSAQGCKGPLGWRAERNVCITALAAPGDRDPPLCVISNVHLAQVLFNGDHHV